jgi:FkbM family methyltransferase
VRSIREFLKAQALTRLPDSWLRALKGRHYERVLRRLKEDEEPDLTVVRQLVAPNTTAIDLGANIGVYTKVLSSLVGRSGRVISVEPVAETFGILSRNVQALGMKNVMLVNAAISDKDEIVTMEVPDYESGGANFYQAQVVDIESAPPRAGRHIRVPSVTLDEIASGEDSVAFVKCDIEGHELRCLAGAQSVIATHHPAWLIEIWGDPDDAGSHAAAVFAVLEAGGYAGWFFDGRLLHLRRPGDRSTNYFFLTATHVSDLQGTAPHLFAQSRRQHLS